MALIHALSKEWKKKQERKWSYMYISIDLHDTIIPSDYKNGDRTKLAIYEDAIECLQYLTSRSDIKLILWTCTHRSELETYLKTFRKLGIEFDFVNENPAEVNNALSDFSKKFYTSLIFDDKAGFYPEADWSLVSLFFHENPYNGQFITK